jgi:hypothetical protein
MTTISMYEASIPNFLHHLENLSKILNKAQTDATTRKIDPAVFITARLAPDMFPLSRQIQIATDGVKGCAARLAGLEVPSFPDTETTFEDLQARIQKTVDFIKTVTPDQINGSEQKDITFKRGKDGAWNFKGLPYLTQFVLPNLYFHITTAYAILRHNGVQLGKLDYLGLA